MYPHGAVPCRDQRVLTIDAFSLKNLRPGKLNQTEGLKTSSEPERSFRRPGVERVLMPSYIFRMKCVSEIDHISISTYNTPARLYLYYQWFVYYERNVAVALSSPGRVTKSQGKGQFWGFFPTDNALYNIAFGTQKNYWTDRNAVWGDEWAWSEK